MTHDEAVALLPVYALGALDDDAGPLQSHLASCDRCRRELADLLEVTTSLGEAAETREPPDALRERVISGFPSPRARTRPRLSWWPLRGRIQPSVGQRGPSPWRPALSPVAAALMVVSLGLAAWVGIEEARLRAARTDLAMSARGLALLTSTETTVVRLQPVTTPGSPPGPTSGSTPASPPGSRAHGHWYHRAGIDTQVIVIEFMPELPRGEAYSGWLHYASGAWRPAGSFHPDRNGYGRAILPGDDGSGVDSVLVTRQAHPTPSPEGTPVLRWPS